MTKKNISYYYILKYISADHIRYLSHEKPSTEWIIFVTFIKNPMDELNRRDVVNYYNINSRVYTSDTTT